MKNRYRLVLVVFIFLSSTLESKIFSQGSTFTFTTSGANALMDTAIAFTGRIWGDYLNSTIPIKVNVYFVNLFGTTLAVTIPNGERDFPSAPIDSVWYASCLANSIAGTELNPGETDMDIYVDTSNNWYYGLDAICPAGKYDFVTIFMHEIGHGLGFLSLAKLEGDTTGSFGYITPADISPSVTSFPFPDLQGKYSIFSYFMENLSGQSLVDTLIFPNPSVVLGDQFTSNNVYFNGPLSVVQNGGTRVRLYAPVTYAPGSSMEHLNEATFPPSNINTLMTPFSGTSEEHHKPGPLTIAILEDIGWSVNHDVGFENLLTDLRMEIFPNPAQTEAFIRLDQAIENEKLEVIDMYGRIVLSTKISIEKETYYSIDFSQLSSGIYMVKIKDGLFKMIKN